LLKKDGHLVLLGGLGGSHYQVGDYNFNSANVSRGGIEQSLEDTGLKEEFYQQVLATEEDKQEFGGIMCRLNTALTQTYFSY